ncbi:MAG: NADH-quinone oxidoreductase subunit C [Desulfovibrionaceae bacterium]|jgi:NADH:ubiquinone oxidoreductase subunit C|nr:NADH-quinone oxidoreductase subunit C [Desulfovibrionaceae bacterium]
MTTSASPDLLVRGLAALCAEDGHQATENRSGNLFHWFRLAGPGDLLDAAKRLAAHGARLCTITAYDPVREHGHPRHELAYHFDCQGAMFTVTIELDEADLRVPSISGLFRNADWNEREFREMYGIEVQGLTNSKRLFLDEKLDAGIMDRVLPVSVLMNGASSRDLWERLLALRAKAEEKA